MVIKELKSKVIGRGRGRADGRRLEGAKREVFGILDSRTNRIIDLYMEAERDESVRRGQEVFMKA